MSETSAALFGALVGGLATVTGGYLAARASSQAVKHESRTRESQEHQGRVRDQLAQVIRLTFAVEYRVFEVSWVAVNDPSRLDEPYAKSYEAEMSRLLPELSGSLVVLAGLAPAVHALIKPWSGEINTIEGIAARALIDLRTNSAAAGTLKDLRAPLIDFYESSGSKVAPAYAKIGERS